MVSPVQESSRSVSTVSTQPTLGNTLVITALACAILAIVQAIQWLRSMTPLAALTIVCGGTALVWITIRIASQFITRQCPKQMDQGRISAQGVQVNETSKNPAPALTFHPSPTPVSNIPQNPEPPTQIALFTECIACGNYIPKVVDQGQPTNNAVQNVPPVTSKTEDPELATSKKLFAQLPCSDKDVENIITLITSLGKMGYANLMLHSIKIYQIGNDVTRVHPLKFLSVILKNDDSKKYLIKIYSSDNKKRKEFVDKLGKNLTAQNKDNNVSKYIKGFANEVKVQSAPLEKYVEKQDWENMVIYLIDDRSRT